MESFTLGQASKIYFSSAQQQHLAMAWERPIQHNNSLSYMEFNTEFLQPTCLGASIYRLQISKIESSSIFLGHIQTVAEGIRMDNCAIGFPNSLEILC